MNNTLIDKFDVLVKKHCSFLIDDYGFSLVKVGNTKYVFSTETTKIQMFIEHYSIVVGIEPTGISAHQLLQKNIVPQSVSPVAIAKALNSNSKYEFMWLDENSSIELIEQNFEREIDLIKQFCVSLLKGNSADWVIIDQYLRSG